MQLKEIHNFVKDLVRILNVKLSEDMKKKLPNSNTSYTEGQLYEANYILEVIEKIIYENKTYDY